jgi:excisionase family DNA binding protein
MPDDSTSTDVAELAAAVRDLIDRIDRGQWGRWLSVEGAAEYCSLSDKSIRNLVADGTLNPSRTVRGRLLVDRQELDAALVAGCGKRLRRGRGIKQS